MNAYLRVDGGGRRSSKVLHKYYISPFCYCECANFAHIMHAHAKLTNIENCTQIFTCMRSYDEMRNCKTCASHSSFKTIKLVILCTYRYCGKVASLLLTESTLWWLSEECGNSTPHKKLWKKEDFKLRVKYMRNWNIFKRP